MSVSGLSPVEDQKRESSQEQPVRSAQLIQESLRNFTIIGIASDALWHHRLRHLYIGYPGTLQTFGIYAFWASVWYCASHAGDWTHAAIARDRDKTRTVPLPAYDGIWDHGAISAAARARNVPLERQRAHMFAYSSLTTVPVLARLTYAYRPWFWQRCLPFKLTWFSAAAFTSLHFLACVGEVSKSRSRRWEGDGLEQGKSE